MTSYGKNTVETLREAHASIRDAWDAFMKRAYTPAPPPAGPAMVPPPGDPGAGAPPPPPQGDPNAMPPQGDPNAMPPQGDPNAMPPQGDPGAGAPPPADPGAGAPPQGGSGVTPELEGVLQQLAGSMEQFSTTITEQQSAIDQIGKQQQSLVKELEALKDSMKGPAGYEAPTEEPGGAAGLV